MPISIKPMACNGLCRSCYENEIRLAGVDTSYNIDAILKTLDKLLSLPKEQRYNAVCLHGGEPLMMKFEDIEKLLDKSYSVCGHTSIQTNGILITPKIIDLFKKYKTSVGVSLDGDTSELNYGRWNAGNLSSEQIQKETDKVLNNMLMVKEAGLSLSVITLLRKYNATSDKIPELIRFLLRMKDEFGVNSIRTNEVVVHDPKYREEEELTNEELGNIYCKLADICMSDPKIQWLPYRDVIDALMGYYDVTCVFTECDIWSTASERCIDKDGNETNCLKGGAALDGFQVLVDERIGRERYTILPQVPQELNGCKDCYYWHMCKGGCPGEGVDNDWRNKSRFCGAWKILFSHVEKRIWGLFPNIKTSAQFYPNRGTPEVGQYSLREGKTTWKYSARKSMEELQNRLGQSLQQSDPRYMDNSHRDGHGDKPHGDSGHGDKIHGDLGHGNQHQDCPDHRDFPHGDFHRDKTLDEKPHGDLSHGDRHGDKAHGDVFHGDKAHGNLPHGDSEHGNQSDVSLDRKNKPHGDKPHGNQHADLGHGDKKHGDSGHGDKSHGNIPHGDQ